MNLEEKYAAEKGRKAIERLEVYRRPYVWWLEFEVERLQKENKKIRKQRDKIKKEVEKLKDALGYSIEDF